LTVSGGRDVSVASAQAMLDEDLDRLETVVIGELEAAEAEERRASAQAERLRAEAIRRVVDLLRPGAGASRGARP
jgi:F-type H+-transporting ATPase subunit epsilon